MTGRYREFERAHIMKRMEYSMTSIQDPPILRPTSLCRPKRNMENVNCHKRNIHIVRHEF